MSPTADPLRRQLHLNAFLMSTGHHEASWRLPESDPRANTDIDHYKNLARIAERGTFDSLFLADGPVLWGDVAQRPGSGGRARRRLRFCACRLADPRGALEPGRVASDGGAAPSH